MGISFLRHIERCICLVFVVDLSSPNPWDQLKVLYNELDQYNSQLRKRPSIVLRNNIDLTEVQNNSEELNKHVGDQSLLLPRYAKEGMNLKELLSHIRTFYDQEGEKLKKKYTEPKSNQIDLFSLKNSKDPTPVINKE